MCSTSFLSFHKVRDDLILEELTLSPDMPAPPRRHSTPTTPLFHLPLLCLIPLAMMTKVKDRVATVAAITRMAMAGVLVVVAATLSAKAIRARAASPALPSWHSFYNPWIGAINIYPGPAPGGGSCSNNTAYRSINLSSLCLARPWSTLPSHDP
jgi:hypothetical protein